MTNRPKAAPTPKAPQTALPPEGLSFVAQLRVELIDSSKRIQLPNDGLLWVPCGHASRLAGPSVSVHVGIDAVIEARKCVRVEGSVDAYSWEGFHRARIHDGKFSLVPGHLFEVQSRHLAARVRFEGLVKAEYSPLYSREFAKELRGVA